MDLWLTSITTIGLLFAIVWVCSLFTNGVEWLGHRFELSDGAIGSVLAAVGTALPETLVPIVAIAGGWWAQQHGQSSGLATGQDIGIGAILGAPFVISTLAMFVTGMAVVIYARLGKRSLDLKLDIKLFRRDLLYFLPSYILAIMVATFPIFNSLRSVVPVGLMLWYGIYVFRTFRKEHVPDGEVDFEPLMLAPKSLEPKTSVILLQTFLGLLGIAITAHFFVQQIEHLSDVFHINPLILSLLIVPIATELPEKFNSVVWIGKQKDNLALGNLTGAMVFQGCTLTALGIALTPWKLTPQCNMSIALCLGSTLMLLAGSWIYKRLTVVSLLVAGLFYVSFLVYSLGMPGLL